MWDSGGNQATLDTLQRTPKKHLSAQLVKMLEQLESQKPNLTEKTSAVLSAFYRFDRERERVGQMASPQHIKQRQIIDYIEINGSHGFERDCFEKIIFEVDEEYLKMFYEKQKREAKKHG